MRRTPCCGGGQSTRFAMARGMTNEPGSKAYKQACAMTSNRWMWWGRRAVVLCSANVPRTGCASPPPLFRCAEHHSTPGSVVEIKREKTGSTQRLSQAPNCPRAGAVGLAQRNKGREAAKGRLGGHSRSQAHRTGPNPRTGCASPPPLFRCAEHHSTPSNMDDIQRDQEMPCSAIGSSAERLKGWCGGSDAAK
jgi:hypothetical protein